MTIRIFAAISLVLALGWVVAHAQTVRPGITCSTVCDGYGHCSTYCN